MVSFAGYEMPVQYKMGIMKEHLFCRKSSVIFDVSHMGQIIVKGHSGGEATLVDKLEQLIPVDLKNLSRDRQRYGFFLNDNGGMIDDLMISNKGNYFMIVANAARKYIDYEHLVNNLGDKFEIIMRQNRSLLAIQGPKSEKVLSRFFEDINMMQFLDAKTFMYKGESVEVSRSGYTGEDGFEVSISDRLVENFTNELLNDPDIMLAGLGARDSLRLDGALCLYGQDINENISPVQARLSWAIQKCRRVGGERQGNFLGSDTIFDQLKNGVDKIRIGLIPEGKAPVRAGTKIFMDAEGEKHIGEVCSGGYSPSLERPISMGYIILSDDVELGVKVFADVRGKLLPVSIVEMPFVKNNFKR